LSKSKDISHENNWNVPGGIFSRYNNDICIGSHNGDHSTRQNKRRQIFRHEHGRALVTAKDAQTGELLAKGVTRGGTGNTSLIMMTPLTRGRPITDESAAGFTVSIDIDSPRLIEVTAYGPLVNLQAANKASATQWVVPGKHITGGDAWVIEIPGFVVDVLAPPTHVNLSGTPQSVDIRANVTMM
jgi:hypothetical protein